MARCTKIIDADSEHPKYVIHVKQFAKFVVNLHKNLAPTDVEEGMRGGWGGAGVLAGPRVLHTVEVVTLATLYQTFF